MAADLERLAQEYNRRGHFVMSDYLGTGAEIARKPDEISDKTKAYVGSLVHYDKDSKIIPIFKRIGQLEHVYTSFPEGRIIFEDVEIGGKTAGELLIELKRKNINISSDAEYMMSSKDFTILKNPQTLRTARLRVGDLGFFENEIPTIDQSCRRAKDLGLYLCPAELGPHKRLKDINQSMNDWCSIAMEQIAGRDGDPHMFALYRNEDGLWLDDIWADPDDGWFLEDELVFSLSPPAGKASK